MTSGQVSLLLGTLAPRTFSSVGLDEVSGRGPSSASRASGATSALCGPLCSEQRLTSKSQLARVFPGKARLPLSSATGLFDQKDLPASLGDGSN